MFFLRVKQTLLTICALLLCGCFCLAFRAVSVVKLHALQGDRVFYLQSASSQGLRKERLSLLDIFSVKGESVRLHKSLSAEEILSQYNAEVLFVEKVGGVTSYYCHIQNWGAEISLQGYPVNLHVAIGEEQTVVGTPIIFGGY